MAVSNNAPLFVPIERALYDEVVRRLGPSGDAPARIGQVLKNYLSDTSTDADVWPALKAAASQGSLAQDYDRTYGDPQTGYIWGPVELLNGDEVRMTYKGEEYLAEVKHNRLFYSGMAMSPSEFASYVAGNTVRNAWRDLEVRLRGGDDEWIPASELRRRAQAGA
ncbi:hypothetical protein [Parvularcula oceani]|uniref:hypothetical protein n=1 Tax=Parvularcula oceani TaxID=1247963 RepID=UPI0004E1F461|nr:hypothetical protein [Parvularcula oceani]